MGCAHYLRHNNHEIEKDNEIYPSSNDNCLIKNQILQPTNSSESSNKNKEQKKKS